MMNYIKLDNALKSEGIIQNIIKKNFKYLNDDMRIQYFYSLLLNKIDENYRYKWPREYQITIDRFKANKFKEKSNESRMPDIQLNETVFGQLFNIFKDIGGKEFLREKGQNLFKVELKNERAIDAGGPYREILSDMCNDLLSDYLELFIKTPNNSNDIGELRDKYIINPNCNNINHKKAFELFSKIADYDNDAKAYINDMYEDKVHIKKNSITFDFWEEVMKKTFEIYDQLKELGYEDRVEQQDMTMDIIQAIEDNQNIVIEARCWNW